MPHQRSRLITAILAKRLKLWPAMGLIGPRQCGKSTLLRELLPEEIKTAYYTFDSENVKQRAIKTPEAFAEPEEEGVKIIDEVQKVPAIFDSVKLHIDQKRRPGSYILSGSTQFSQLLGIRESLTGRLALIHLYPFTLSEIHEMKFGNYFLKKVQEKSRISLQNFDQKITKGGMPGFFYLHSVDEFAASARMWVETTCFRDLGRVIKKNFDGDLAYSILVEAAQAEVPTVSEIGARLEIDARIVKRYLDGFCEILVLQKINPHVAGVGKSHYLIVDSGLSTFLGASRESAVRTHVLIEALSLFEAEGLQRPQIEYYRSEKKSFVPLVFSWKHEKKTLAVQISDRESPRLGEIRSLQSFLDRIDGHKRGIVLNQSSTSYFEQGLEFHPLRG